MLEVGLGRPTRCSERIRCRLRGRDQRGSRPHGVSRADRESIGLEKAGIFRAGGRRCAATTEPASDADRPCRAVSARRWLLIGRDFGYSAGRGNGNTGARGASAPRLPYPALRGAYQLANAAAALAALEYTQ